MEPLLDYVSLLESSLASPTLRAAAADHLVGRWIAQNPLAASHGDHVLRPSSMGRCSLEFATASLGLHDLPIAAGSRLVMDEGTLLGAWIGALLAAAVPDGYAIALERPVVYRGVPGSIDVLATRLGDGATEVVEVKTTPAKGALKAPDAAKPSQCLQAATYALGAETDRFTLLTIGYNVGLARDGMPHPKFRCDTYDARDWRALVDAEIDRLEILAMMTKRDLLADAAKLADTSDTWRCGYCRFSACPRNTNPARLAL